MSTDVADLMALTPLITAALTPAGGERWEVDPAYLKHRDFRIIQGPYAARIALHARGGRLKIVGIYPTSHCAAAVGFSINVDAARGPETVAREIERRLLPNYLPALGEVHDYEQAKEDDDNERRSIATSLAQMLPMAEVASASSTGEGRSEVRFRTRAGEAGLLTLFSSDSGAIEMRSATVSTLIQVAGMLAQL